MSTRTVSVHEAEKHLADLIGLAAKGDEIVIAQGEGGPDVAGQL